MKKAVLFLLLAYSFSAKAQTLKELLYSGKLKKDSGVVIRSTDDLKSKIDTATKKAEPEKATIAATTGDSATKTANTMIDPVTGSVEARDSATVAANPVNATPVAPPPAKSPNKVWKEYTDSLISSMKDVLSSKKVKKETYFFTVNYEIDTDGSVNVTNVTAAPENDYLQEQVKQHLLLSPPQLNPVLDSTNKPHKVKRRYNFTITKE
ncbi:MAG: hypothetical protein ACTHOF_11055 [Flavisolibacter sp.]